MLDEDPSATAFVPIQAGQTRIVIAAARMPGRAGDADEAEVAGRRPSLNDVVAGITVVAQEISHALRATQADRVTVEFGCDFGWETGSVVAVFGKATAQSAIKVGLEWNSRPPQG
ncbi:CU044_2847 family protein [Allorhizocola rhizosphaerae]|uniref:CU044_2847 family protein n=1 Tax=Allorhizocola rhizosphaerae TaxID=1872709 RepID=UPI0013C3322A|nr:CU044_2847 family protein [Allorhizocola rhizosphaerae]